MLDIYAGKTAFDKIEKEGFKQELFTSFLGASGGPKWFCLFELDKYVFGEFFNERSTELNLIGSSAGAFRSACFAQNDPVAAISRMAKSYSETVYSKNAKPDEITNKAIELLDLVLGQTGAEEIVNNQIFKVHFLVNKANGFVSSENKLIQSIGLVKSFVLNRIDRGLLRSQYERYIFKNPISNVEIEDQYKFMTRYINLTPENLKNALLASGSIPMVMKGIRNIKDAPEGIYRDGGIIDYHFDVHVKNNDGLILYPHFNANPKPGWFDKNLNRSVSPKNYENILMLVPSEEFVSSLPYGKIPDRKDFTELEPDTRIKYWKTVLKETEKLADSFEQFILKEKIDKIKVL